jgi:hypothetical protein
MPSESRVKRWRDNKRQQGLKHVSVWLTPEEEMRLKDLAIQWHCSPSQVIQRALAQLGTTITLEHSSPTDMLQIQEMIRAEVTAAVQAAQLHATVGDTVGSTVGDAVGPTVLPTNTYTQHTPPSETCPPFDPANNVLGKLCPRRHEWGTTGQSLLRRSNSRCRACENESRRERRAAKREPTQP